jgi:anti-sigma regulatory factor (Ser/Thr protein kinase)
MPLELEEITAEANGHLVQFYEDDAQLAQTVGGYLTRAMQSGAVAVVIATEAHGCRLLTELKSAGIDTGACSREGTLILLDAAATMAGFVDHGEVDDEAFNRVLGSVLRRAAATGRAVCAYGEMVALLWEAGDVLTAIELEKAWNHLADELPFTLVCGYRSESVQGNEHADALHEVCRLHTSVVGRPSAGDCGPAREPADATPPEALSAHFSREPQAPALARHFVTDLLQRLEHSALLEDAKLVVSELATNAMVHARSSFTVEVHPRATGVRLSVRDASRTKPTLSDHDALAISGRGLRLIDMLAANWGVELADDGKTVWAELRV